MSTSSERFIDLFRMRDVQGVAIILATIALGLEAAFSLGVALHAVIASNNVYLPNLADSRMRWLVQPVFWVAAFVLLLTGQRRWALLAGGIGLLVALLDIVRQATAGHELFAYQQPSVQWLTIGILGIVALFFAKDAQLPATPRFREISAGVATTAFALLMTTPSWNASGFSTLRVFGSGWTFSFVLGLLPLLVRLGAFLLLRHNPRFLIAAGLLGLGEIVSMLVASVQSLQLLWYLVPNLLTGFLWIALPVALGNLALVRDQERTEDPRHSV